MHGKGRGTLHEASPEVSTRIRARGARAAWGSGEQAAAEAALRLVAAILWKCTMEEGGGKQAQSRYLNQKRRGPLRCHDAALKHATRLWPGV